MANHICSVKGCDGPAHGRGWCVTHYRRWQTHGDVQADIPLTRYLVGVPAPERFARSVNASGGPDACHPWTAARDPKGYGRFRDGGVVLATRWLLGHLRGAALGPDEHACHRCDNPPCVNPRHLYIGTHQQNMGDLVARPGHYNAHKTHCPRGHPYTGDNLYIIPSSGSRVCRACVRERRRKANQR